MVLNKYSKRESSIVVCSTDKHSFNFSRDAAKATALLGYSHMPGSDMASAVEQQEFTVRT